MHQSDPSRVCRRSRWLALRLRLCFRSPRTISFCGFVGSGLFVSLVQVGSSGDVVVLLLDERYCLLAIQATPRLELTEGNAVTGM